VEVAMLALPGFPADIALSAAYELEPCDFLPVDSRK